MTDDLFPEYTEGLDEEWREAFDTLVGQGKAPSGVRAAIEYATTLKSQQQAAEEWNTTMMTMRNLKDDVIEAGPIDGDTSTDHYWSKTKEKDYLDSLAEELGWEEGDQYRIQDNSPFLTMDGWREIHELIVGKMEDH